MKNTCILLLLLICLLIQSSRLFAQIPDKADKPNLTTEEAEKYYLNLLLEDPYIKNHFGWKLFFAQHPMYLLVSEDRGVPVVGERIPPWGAATKEEYVERVRRNLKSLEELPELRLNYQWSALELEDMCKKFPDVYEKMKRLLKNGSLDFLGGTYSQAHLQALTSESNWRQFEYGHEVYKKLFNKQIKIYSRQEPGLHQQLPQLLKIFDYEFGTVPAFVATVDLLKGPFEFIIQQGRMEPVNGQGFLNNVGLDGSSIPFYIQVELGWDDISIAHELQQDLCSSPKIFDVFPDLDEIDKKLYDKKRKIFDWVLLKDALEEEYPKNSHLPKARIYTNFSYNEGVWAEKLFRTMRKAESAALLTEQINAMAVSVGLPDRSSEIKDIWKTILKSQHHDVSWIEVTDLKRKSINSLNLAIEKCNHIMNDLTSELIEPNEKFISVFNGLPRRRKALVVLEGNKSLDKAKFQTFGDKSFGFVDLPAGGFASFREKNNPEISVNSKLPVKIENKYYSIKLSGNGLIEQISVNGKKLLKTNSILGGQIKARIYRKWYDNNKAKVQYYKGDVFDTVVRETSINTIPLKETYYYFKNKPYFKVELEFDFQGNEVGYMWFDETKLNVYYPTNGKIVHHDIPFGYRKAKQNRPLIATNWVECGGLVYVHRGNVKQWVKDGVIANVLAWGDNHFTNRLHWDWIENSQYDLKLYGKQKIEYYIIPEEKFDGNSTVKIVDEIISPVFARKGNGVRSFYSITDQNFRATAIYSKNGEIWIRGYELPGGESKKFKEWEIVNEKLSNLQKP